MNLFSGEIRPLSITGEPSLDGVVGLALEELSSETVIWLEIEIEVELASRGLGFTVEVFPFQRLMRSVRVVNVIRFRWPIFESVDMVLLGMYLTTGEV